MYFYIPVYMYEEKKEDMCIIAPIIHNLKDSADET